MGKNFLRKVFVTLITVAWGLMVPLSLVLAQVSFPTHPVTVWVGFPPGGGTDIIMRALAEGSEKSLGQKIVVINKPGGGGAVCASLLAKGKPDGYTLGAFPDTPITRAPHLMDLDYDPLRDFSFVIRIGLWKNVFVARADSPFKKWEEVVIWAKKNPGQLVYGHPGVGTTPHIAIVKVGIREGFTFKGVPFTGTAPLVSAVLGGHVMVGGVSSLPARSHVEALTMRALLVFEKEGLDFAPHAPTFEKMNYNFETPTCGVVCAPKGIPDPVREALEKAFIDGKKTETFRMAAKNQELLLTEPLTGKNLFEYLKKCYLLYEQYIKEAGIYKIEKK